MSAVQKPGESVLDYTNRIDRLVHLAIDLGCTWHDLGSARCLTGLAPKFEPFKQATLAANKALSLSQIYAKVTQWEAATKMSEDAAQAHLAMVSPPTPVTPTPGTVSISSDEYANLLRHQRGKRPRTKYEPQDDSEDDRPTCFYCGKVGHKSAKCFKRLKKLEHAKTADAKPKEDTHAKLAVVTQSTSSSIYGGPAEAN